MLSQIFYAETKRAQQSHNNYHLIKIVGGQKLSYSRALALQHPKASQAFLLFSLFKWTPTSVVH